MTQRIKTCYDCKLHPTCYARNAVDDLLRDLISRFWIGMSALDKVYKVLATHCSHYIKRDDG